MGQPSALETIVPSLHLPRSGLAPEGRPVGTFLLLGPTGTCKTRNVEAIAEVLHGTPHERLALDDEDALVCDAHDFSVPLEPFLSDELVGALEARGARLSKVTAAGG